MEECGLCLAAAAKAPTYIAMGIHPRITTRKIRNKNKQANKSFSDTGIEAARMDWNVLLRVAFGMAIGGLCS